MKEPEAETQPKTNLKTGDRVIDGLSFVLWWVVGIGVVVFITTMYRAELFAAKAIKGGLGSGVFGDAFGFATSIFTGAAFLGLLITMRMQRIELSDIRDERRTAQATLSSQIEQANEARDELFKRSLEDRAFRMIETIRRKYDELGVVNVENIGRLQHAKLEEALLDPGSQESMNSLLELFGNENTVRRIRGHMCPELHAALESIHFASLDDEICPILINAANLDAFPIYATYFLEKELKYYHEQITNPERLGKKKALNPFDAFEKILSRTEDIPARRIEVYLAGRRTVSAMADNLRQGVAA
ncbi:hypothetical protein [Leisingera sp. ANG-M6]|uniref:hypothetical protein n=1 Tax=Leisingera sp. ANG-M6 TaxID=1577900 RepID=UPI00057D88F0|nr:hypothetical protein [Leisingera sp. ANG-M6]KIC30063.1 hypothetical protein RA24_03740 [Leisingera sp. ANG-M6]